MGVWDQRWVGAKRCGLNGFSQDLAMPVNDESSLGGRSFKSLNLILGFLGESPVVEYLDRKELKADGQKAGNNESLDPLESSCALSDGKDSFESASMT